MLAGESLAGTRIEECYRLIAGNGLATLVLIYLSRRRTPIQQSKPTKSLYVFMSVSMSQSITQRRQRLLV